VNGGSRRASARIQGARLRTSSNDGAIRRREEEEDNAMMRSLTAALLATALIAGPAFAASATGDAGKTPAAATAAGSGKTVEKQAAKHRQIVKTHHALRHVVHHKGGKITYARHVNRLKKHRHHVAAHVGKPGKIEKAGNSDKS